jgi:uncharacterized protein
MSGACVDPLEVSRAAVTRLTTFGRALRLAGLPVDTTRMIEFCRCTAELPPGDLYWAGRATLIARHEEIAVYDRIFDAFFSGRLEIVDVPPLPTLRLREGGRDDASDAEGASSGSAGTRAPSRLELLRAKTFEPCAPEESATVQHLVAAFRRRPPLRVARRLRPAARGKTDLRRTFRGASRTAGEPLLIHRRSRSPRPRRVVLAVDVSGSMAPYSRAPLLFAHSALRAGLPWHAYCFGTRLTDVTSCLRSHSSDVTLAAVAAAVEDFDGGTRIAESLANLLGSSARVAARIRGALVLVVSDGLELGDPAELGRRMRDVRRLAHRVVWINPLKATAGYAPTAGGMAAALPSVDCFVAGQDLRALAALVPDLRRLAR